MAARCAHLIGQNPTNYAQKATSGIFHRAKSDIDRAKSDIGLSEAHFPARFPQGAIPSKTKMNPAEKTPQGTTIWYFPNGSRATVHESRPMNHELKFFPHLIKWNIKKHLPLPPSSCIGFFVIKLT